MRLVQFTSHYSLEAAKVKNLSRGDNVTEIGIYTTLTPISKVHCSLAVNTKLLSTFKAAKHNYFLL